MWLKILEFLLSSGSFIYSAWEKIRNKQEVKAELTQEEKDADTKAVAEAAKARAGANDSKLLISPDER